MIIGIRPKTRLAHAIPLILIAALFNAFMGACVKVASDHIPTENILFWRNLVSLILLMCFLPFSSPHKDTIKEKLKTKRFSMHLVRALSGLASVACYFYSLKYLTLSDATLLSNSTPLFVPFVAAIWLKSKIHHQLWWGLSFAAAGVLLVLQPGGEVFQLASFIALASGVFGAFATLAIRQSHYTEPVVRTMFYYFFIATVLMGSMSLSHFESDWGTFTLNDLWILLLIGVFGAFYQLFLTLATKHAPSRLLSSFLFMNVLFSMILDWYFWQRVISPLMLVGFGLVALGVILVVLLYPKENY